MLKLYPVYSLWNRCKTLTGSLDPTCANGTNKPCIIGGELIGGESSLYVLFHRGLRTQEKEIKIPGMFKLVIDYCKSEYLVRE